MAHSDINVLVLGESGTGKELIARAIHNLSKGKTNPFVPVNCGALPENLFESELFGHEKGAFTGASQSKPGLLEFANQGTFFFDEIGDMSAATQVKILRMLEEKKIRRIGGHKEIEIDVRVIAATNKNIDEAVMNGMFREDLLYRLNTFTITLPPLRDRKEDIIFLAKHFMKEICCKNSNHEKVLSNDAQDILVDYQWPGNIRELQNIINRAYYLSQGNIVDTDDIPLQKIQKKFKLDSEIVDLQYKDAKEKILEQFEIEYLTHHLKKNNGNISKTAQNCDLDRRSIHRIVSKHNIIFKD
ncbi:MAG: sigma-54-dependent Fis family transcriptional regulator [Melioribacteraceae bacterium]|nr:sigma-54-dependent Fis family transcriptional regulator [Melioribacteraceae bacterium]